MWPEPGTWAFGLLGAQVLLKDRREASQCSVDGGEVPVLPLE